MNSKRYKQQYIDWVIQHNIAFYTATSPETLELLKAGAYNVINEILPHSRITMSKWVRTSYEKRLKITSDKLLEVECLINISADAWKGDKKRNYLAVCSHFIDGQGRQNRMLMGFPRILGSKTGENEVNLIGKVLTTLGIDCTRL